MAQTTDLVSGVPLLMGDEAKPMAIPHTGTSIEILPMTDIQLVITPTDLQGMKVTGMTDGIPTLVQDHPSAKHVATVHHLGTTHHVDALLAAMRTDIPLMALQVLDMCVSILLLTATR